MKNSVNKPIIIKKNLLRTAGFFVLFALLCSLFYIPCFCYVKKIVKSRTIEQCQNYLDNKIILMDASLKSINSVDSILSGTGTSLSHTYSNTELSNLKLSDTRKLLVDYFAPYNFVSDFGIIYQGRPVLDRYMIFYERDPLRYSQYLYSEDSDYWSYFENPYGVIPEKYFSVKNHGVDQVITFYTRLSRQQGSFLYVQYPTELLFHLFVNDYLFNVCEAEISYKGAVIARYGTVTEKFSSITGTCSNPFGITVTVKIPDSYVEQEIQSFVRMALAFMTMLVLTLGVFIVIFSYVSSKPFNTASEALYRSGYIDSSFDQLSSSEFLITAVKHLDSKLSNCSSIIESQKERSRVQMFERALYRGLFSSDSYLHFQEIFPDFPKEWKLYLLRLQEANKGMETTGIEICEKISLNFLPCYCQPFDQNSTLFLLPEADSAKFDGFCESYKGLKNITLIVHTSDVFHDPSDLSDAFQQIEYSLFMNRPGEAPEDENLKTLNIHHLQTIYYSLEAGDYKTAVSTLENGTASFVRSNDKVKAKHAYHALSYVLLELELEKANLEDIPIPTFNGARVTEIFQSDFPECFRQITDSIIQEKNEQLENIEERIIEYIGENYQNQQFSLISVTEHFHISAPTLQKRMNTAVGMTFSAYLESIRLKKARQMLFCSDRSIQEIAEATGYTNTNSFYKAYRRVYGESPRSSRKTP